MTFTNDPATVDVIRDMMLSSRETFLNYTMPLGLHHLIGGDHYAPMPWNDKEPRQDWTATYYHRASATGIGVDRTRRGDTSRSIYIGRVLRREQIAGRGRSGCSRDDELVRRKAWPLIGLKHPVRKRVLFGHFKVRLDIS